MSICYTSSHGIPLGRQHRPLVAWYGDLDFMPHIKEFIARGAVDAVVSYGEPVRVDAATDRKAMTRQLEGAVRAMATAALLRRPIPAASAALAEAAGAGNPGCGPATGAGVLKSSAKSTICSGDGAHCREKRDKTRPKRLDWAGKVHHETA